MFNKVYTCNLVVIGSGELKQASMTCSFKMFTSTMDAMFAMRVTLDDDDLHDHKMVDIRRLR